MKTKLTLRLDDRLIRWAKAHARRSGKSVSQIVADYFVLLSPRYRDIEHDLTPIVKSLKGTLQGSDVDTDDHKRHLEEKYL
jgi:hypothetical protein